MASVRRRDGRAAARGAGTGRLAAVVRPMAPANPANDNRASVGRRIARLVPFLAAASALAAALWSAFG